MSVSNLVLLLLLTRAQSLHCVAMLMHTHMYVQARSAEVVSLSRETAELLERVEAAEAAADKYEGKYRAAKVQLQEAEASCGQQATELHHLSQAFKTEQTTARQAHEAVETLATRLTAIQVGIVGVRSGAQCPYVTWAPTIDMT